MAQSRLFNATGDYAKVASGVTIPTTTGTIVVVFYPTYNPVDSANHLLFDCSDGATVEFTINKNTANTITYGWWSGAGCNRFFLSSVLPTQNAWNVCAFEWNTAGNVSITRMNNIDGGGFTDDGNCRFDTSAIPVRVGNIYSENINASARISRVGIWSSMLSTAHLGTIQDGAILEKVSPTTLVSSWIVDPNLSFVPSVYTATSLRLPTISGTTLAAGRNEMLRGYAGRVW